MGVDCSQPNATLLTLGQFTNGSFGYLQTPYFYLNVPQGNYDQLRVSGTSGLGTLSFSLEPYGAPILTAPSYGASFPCRSGVTVPQSSRYSQMVHILY